MTISRDPVFFAMMQSSLQRAYPSGLPSNQVLTQFAMPYDTAVVSDAMRLTLIQQGYPYGWWETVATSGAGTYSLTEPLGACWLLRLDAFKHSGASVSLSASIGGGATQSITRIDPAQTIIYADDLFTWSQASMLGFVGMSPWGNPGTPMIEQQLWPLMRLFDSSISAWPDNSAVWLGPTSNSATSEPIGEWMLKKWIFVPSTDTYTISFCGDGLANLYIDGTSVIYGAVYTNPAILEYPISAGWHLLSVSCLNTGSTPNPTGVLISIQDSSGNIIENGSDSPALGSSWQTSGFINPTWTAVSSEDDMRYAWYVIPAYGITSESVTLTVSASGSPAINGIQWYTVPPWRWDYGGIWDGTASANTPAQVNPVQSTEVVG